VTLDHTVSPKPEAATAPDVKSNVNMTASGSKRGANEIIELSSDEEDNVQPKVSLPILFATLARRDVGSKLTSGFSFCIGHHL
jgi:hypothetical protein